MRGLCGPSAPRERVCGASSGGVEDDYVYYPDYEIYYSSSRHQYAYLEGGAWVSRPAPRGVSVNVLMASRSVKMDFHDSPANHHAEVVKQYPKNRAQPGSNQGQKDNRKDDQRDQQGDNRGDSRRIIFAH